MLLLSGLGLFFSAILLTYNKGYKTANLYLGLFLFFLNYLALYHYLIIFNDSQDILAVLLCIPIIGSAYLVGPLAYLYVKSIIQDNAQFSKYHAIHFIMFGIIFIGSLPYNLTSWFVKYQAANDIINHSWNSLCYSPLMSPAKLI
jgi:hypothetical protein